MTGPVRNRSQRPRTLVNTIKIQRDESPFRGPETVIAWGWKRGSRKRDRAGRREFFGISETFRPRFQVRTRVGRKVYAGRRAAIPQGLIVEVGIAAIESAIRDRAIVLPRFTTPIDPDSQLSLSDRARDSCLLFIYRSRCIFHAARANNRRANIRGPPVHVPPPNISQGNASPDPQAKFP